MSALLTYTTHRTEELARWEKYTQTLLFRIPIIYNR